MNNQSKRQPPISFIVRDHWNVPDTPASTSAPPPEGSLASAGYDPHHPPQTYLDFLKMERKQFQWLILKPHILGAIREKDYNLFFSLVIQLDNLEQPVNRESG